MSSATRNGCPPRMGTDSCRRTNASKSNVRGPRGTQKVLVGMLGFVGANLHTHAFDLRYMSEARLDTRIQQDPRGELFISGRDDWRAQNSHTCGDGVSTMAAVP